VRLVLEVLKREKFLGFTRVNLGFTRVKRSPVLLRRRLGTWGISLIDKAFVLTPRKLRPSTSGQFPRMGMMFVLSCFGQLFSGSS
jgi:hypothetical protein